MFFDPKKHFDYHLELGYLIILYLF